MHGRKGDEVEATHGEFAARRTWGPGIRVFAELSVRVEYSLTPLGWSMAESLIALSRTMEEVS